MASINRPTPPIRKASDSDISGDSKRVKQDANDTNDTNDILELYYKAQILSRNQDEQNEQNDDKDYLSEEHDSETEAASPDTAQRSAVILLPRWAGQFNKTQRRFVKGWGVLGMLEMRRWNTHMKAWHEFGCCICQTFLGDDVQLLEKNLDELRRAKRDISSRVSFWRWKTSAMKRQEDTTTERANCERSPKVELEEEDADNDMEHHWEDCPRKERVGQLRSWITALKLHSTEQLDWSTDRWTCGECGITRLVCTETEVDGDTMGSERCKITREKVWAVAGCIWLWGGRQSRGKEREIREWVWEMAEQTDFEQEERERVRQGLAPLDGEQGTIQETDDSDDSISRDGDYSGEDVRECLAKETFVGLTRTRVLLRMIAKW